ncbi:MAG: YhdP family protein [bacterium]
MTREQKHILIYVAEGLGVFLALIAGIMFYAHWQVSNEGLSLNILRGQVSEAMEQRLAPGSQVEISNLTLRRDTQGKGEAGPLILYADNIKISNQFGERRAVLPSLAFELTTRDILRGNLVPRYVYLSDARLVLQRLANGQVDLGLAANDLTGSVSAEHQENALQQLMANSDSFAGSLFEGATLTNSMVVFHDELTGQHWQAENVRTELWKAEDGYAASLTAPFNINNRISVLEVDVSLHNQDQRIDLSVNTDKLYLADLLEVSAGPELARMIDANLKGKITASFDYDGAILATNFDFTSTDGQIKFGDKELPLAFLKLNTDYIPQTRSFEISELRYDMADNQGVIDGMVSFGPINQATGAVPDQMQFALDFRELKLNAPGILSAPVNIDNLSAEGVHNFATNQLAIERLAAVFYDANLSGALTVLLPDEAGQSAGVVANASVAGALTPQQVLSVWPLPLAEGARKWVSLNLKAGRLRNVEFNMNLPRGMIRKGYGINDDMMRLSFDFDQVTAQIVKEMTPITQGSGSAVILGNSLELHTRTGKIANINLDEGSVVMSAFYPKDTKSRYRATLSGGVKDLLSLVDEPPLGYISKSGFSPDNFSGQGQFTIEIGRANRSYVPIENYDFIGDGHFSNLTLTDFKEGLDLSNASGTVHLTNKDLEINAKAEIQQTPTDIVWLRQFGDEGLTNITVSGVLNAAAADRFGFSIRKILHGDAPYTLNVSDKDHGKEQVMVDIDLTPATIDLKMLGWHKPQGAKGQLSFLLEPPRTELGEDIWNYQDISILADTIDVQGSVIVQHDRGLLKADFKKIFVEGMTDIEAHIDRTGEAMIARFSGHRFNFSPFLDKLLNPAGAGGAIFPEPVLIDIKLDEAAFKKGVRLSGVDAKLVHNGNAFEDISVSGDFTAQHSLVVSMTESADNIGKQFTIETDNFGQLLQGIFGLKSISDGQAVYSGTILNDGRIAGTVAAKDFRLRDTPFVARILSAGSVSGLNDLMIGEGIEFTTLKADLQYGDGTLNIVQAKATGSSVGVSAEGDVQFKHNQFNLHGAFAPAYSVNSALGSLPGLGELLVSRDGEGIVAFSYDIKGPVIEPVITVNTLSLFTPGIFRRIFEPVRGYRPTTSELLEEAILAAEQNHITDYSATPEQLRELSNSLEGVTGTIIPSKDPLQE